MRSAQLAVGLGRFDTRFAADQSPKARRRDRHNAAGWPCRATERHVPGLLSSKVSPVLKVCWRAGSESEIQRTETPLRRAWALVRISEEGSTATTSYPSVDSQAASRPLPAPTSRTAARARDRSASRELPGSHPHVAFSDDFSVSSARTKAHLFDHQSYWAGLAPPKSSCTAVAVRTSPRRLHSNHPMSTIAPAQLNERQLNAAFYEHSDGTWSSSLGT